jgi:fatty acid desaturase
MKRDDRGDWDRRSIEVAVARKRTLFRRFLHSPYASCITHFSLLALLAGEFGLMIWAPLWAVIIPFVAIHHRIGILLHEYMHGIPFRSYKNSVLVFSAVNGLLITFGFLEVFRGNHLAHHRWLNTEKDPGHWKHQDLAPKPSKDKSLWILHRILGGGHGPSFYFKMLYRSITSDCPYIKPRRVLIEAIMSLAWIAFWLLIGMPTVPLILMAGHLCVMPPAMFRGAMEHTSKPGDPNFANEYRVWIPLFNMNRHIHHHLDPRCPWYLLEFCTPEPQAPIGYWTHWYHTFVKRDYTFMRPMTRHCAASFEPDAVILKAGR